MVRRGSSAENASITRSPFRQTAHCFALFRIHPCDYRTNHEARITGTAALQLRPGERSLSTMCIGVGQGIAIALERV